MKTRRSASQTTSLDSEVVGDRFDLLFEPGNREAVHLYQQRNVASLSKPSPETLSYNLG
ncbi:MAG: hypothetical protein J07HQX50_02005 [Haloquadratum sp. J07HQX50]|nr:MAG: hypothetical protein J07HQX50_02005 [Haloquadratum sp. J07HQX50]